MALIMEPRSHKRSKNNPTYADEVFDITIVDLAPELLLYIFQYLPIKDLASLALLNKYLRTVSEDLRLWKDIAKDELPDSATNKIHPKKYLANAYHTKYENAMEGLKNVLDNFPNHLKPSLEASLSTIDLYPYVLDSMTDILDEATYQENSAIATFSNVTLNFNIFSLDKKPQINTSILLDKFLDKYGAIVTTNYCNLHVGYTLMHLFAAIGDLPGLQKLYDAGGDISTQSINGDSPLSYLFRFVFDNHILDNGRYNPKPYLDFIQKLLIDSQKDLTKGFMQGLMKSELAILSKPESNIQLTYILISSALCSNVINAQDLKAIAKWFSQNLKHEFNINVVNNLIDFKTDDAKGALKP